MSERRRTVEIVALMLLFLGILAFTVAGFYHNWMPPVASRHGGGVDGVIVYLLRATGPILVLGGIVLVVFLWRYGRGRHTDVPRTSARAELWWSIVPVITMMALTEVGVVIVGFPVWEQIYAEPSPDALVIEVTGRQFEWLVRYPGPDGAFGRVAPELVSKINPVGIDETDPQGADDIVLNNRLYVPRGRQIDVQLRGRDVLHSFSVAAFRIKQDVVPGMWNRAVFVPTTAGEFEIACTQVCGMGHYRMRGTIYVTEPAEFDAWLQSQPGWLQR